jgi:hypothetical protein
MSQHEGFYEALRDRSIVCECIRLSMDHFVDSEPLPLNTHSLLPFPASTSSVRLGETLSVRMACKCFSWMRKTRYRCKEGVVQVVLVLFKRCMVSGCVAYILSFGYWYVNSTGLFLTWASYLVYLPR